MSLPNLVSSTGGFLLGVDEASPTVYFKASAKDPRTSTADYPAGSLVLYCNGADSALLQKRGSGSDDWVAVSQDTGATNGVEQIAAAGALSVSVPVSQLTVSGTKAYTLAAPAFVGQRKTVECIAAASIPLGTLTLADVYGSEPTTHVFTEVGQRLELLGTATGWKVQDKKRTGEQAVVVGTDVLTGYDMAKRYNLSVTGTVTGAAASGFNIPDGLVPGEQIDVQVTTAASIPDGEIDITAATLDNGAATKIDDINGTTSHHARFEWDGAAWQVVSITGLTVA